MAIERPPVRREKRAKGKPRARPGRGHPTRDGRVQGARKGAVRVRRGLLSTLWARPVNFGQISGTFDTLALLSSFLLCHWLYFGDLDFSPPRLMTMVATVFLAYVVLGASGTYRDRRPRRLHRESARLLALWSVTVATIGLLTFLTKIAEDVSRLWFGLSTSLAYVVLVGVRVAWLSVRVLLKRTTDELRTVVIVGAGERGGMTLSRLRASTSMDYEVVALFDDVPARVGAPLPYGPIAELEGFVEARRREKRPIAEVWIMLPLGEEQRIRQISEGLRDSSVDVCIVPDQFGLRLLTGSVARVSDVPIVNISDIRLPERAEVFKLVFDRVVASVALVLFAPVMLVAALAVRLESPGPVLFRQHRYGVDGQEIEVWKFRSMRVQEGGESVAQATRGDARVTRVGAFLRRTSLDELPQLLNVLQGHMSIVGPRPHAVSHNEQYRVRIDGYMMRHKIKPGITGWAQVNGWRGETDTLEKMEKRVQFDLEYIRNWSISLDIKIMLLTVTRGFTGRNVY